MKDLTELDSVSSLWISTSRILIYCLHGFIDVGNITNNRLSGILPNITSNITEDFLKDVNLIVDFVDGSLLATKVDMPADKGGFRLPFEKEFDELPTVIATNLVKFVTV